MVAPKKPTIEAYTELQQAYDYFNQTLFDGDLPDLMITFQRGKHTLGYFSPERFIGKSKLSELAMNPDYFGTYSLVETLSTLVHEMVHVWQHYMPVKKARRGYHDRIWGEKMEQVGLMPSNTAREGGKKTGQQMDHYIIRGGRFQTAVYDLLKNGFSISWYDKWGVELYAPTKINKAVFDDWLRVTDPNDKELISKLTKTIHKKDNIERDTATFTIEDEENEREEMAIPKPPIKGTGTRTKFTCAQCGLNVWAKPTANIYCGDCDVKLETH
ncbi:zinc metalloproteinase Mpr protein [Yersinia enterocolitica]|uniref:SprT domain-containing protein n=1 Tax=Proteus terrae subsp. cibarius TaxID=626774 RepID=A0ABX6JT14_9GAMM|nr:MULTISPECIES: SprT-like domain-containing protein [Enterobacterales]MBU5964347.1 SprT-like domain-containing protein [Proteus mirabilis]QGW05309.1 SprT family zinc-dependent metalloprotease [Proteus terrae subsp. cibarius]QHD96416.1 sprT domain-containing protein [Proteus terrae subsp. cibarius]QIF92343.1 sprT domain-containing protein [Proteus terrae subsp. cibarius]QJW53143.1 sprT domain-containing protein [Proteus terrae subsp. cibarius]